MTRHRLRRDPTRVAIVVEGFLSRLSLGLVSLALPLYALDLGMGLGEIGLLVSVNVVVQLVVKPVAAPLADRFGYRRSLLVAIAGRSLVCLLFALATAPWALFAVRAVYGLTQALRDPPLNALIAEAGGTKQVAQTFGWYHTAKNVAASLGRAAAGVLLVAGPDEDYRRVFLVAFALSVLPLGVVGRWLRPTARVPAPTTAGRAHRPRVARFTSVAFLFGTTAGMLNLFPAIAETYFHLSPAQIGLVMLASTVALIICGPLFGFLADHVSRGLVLGVRGFANIGSSVLYLVFPTLAGVAAAKVVDDAGKAAFRPAWGSVMAEVARAHPERRARVMALIEVGEDAGDAAGPALAGWLLTLGGLPLMLGVRCGLAVVTEAWTWWTVHHRPAPAAGTAPVTPAAGGAPPPAAGGPGTAC